MMKLPQLRPKIVKAYQTYVDEPIYARPKPVVTSPIAMAVSAAFNGDWSPTPQKQPILLRYEHTKLRWMKPDGRGGLVPKGMRDDE